MTRDRALPPRFHGPACWGLQPRRTPILWFRRQRAREAPGRRPRREGRREGRRACRQGNGGRLAETVFSQRELFFRARGRPRRRRVAGTSSRCTARREGASIF